MGGCEWSYLNPIKRQVILISRCRVDIPPPTLLIGSDVIKVVPNLVDYARIPLLLFLYKVLHVRHPCYLFLLFRFASSARTQNLEIPPHCSLAMSQSFVVLGCWAWNAQPHGMKILPTRVDDDLNGVVVSNADC
jgi:hypothetical protein